MPTSGGPADAGDASHSPARAAALQVAGAGPLVRLPEDSLAVEWWLARRAIEATAGDDQGVPFSDGGVLALWPERRHETDRWTFGLEFEFAVADAGWVAAELHALGLTATPELASYHGERRRGAWTVEHDRSVTSVFTCDRGGAPVVVGGEVVSPPLCDTPDSWRQVAQVLAVLKRCGAEVNRTCGLHVHIGADALSDRDRRGATALNSTDPALRGAHEPARDLLPALSRLAMLTTVCFEDLVFRLASAEGGAHRGRAFYYRHCRPLERALRPAYGSLQELTGDLGHEGAARRAALNLTNVGDPLKDTVEFRQCNGTLDGRVVQAFVRLCAALVGAARWQPEVVRLDPEPLGTHYHAGGAESGTPALPEPATLWRFLSAVFPQGLPAEAAASLLWLFRRGAWQPSLSALAAV